MGAFFLMFSFDENRWARSATSFSGVPFWDWPAESPPVSPGRCRAVHGKKRVSARPCPIRPRGLRLWIFFAEISWMAPAWKSCGAAGFQHCTAPRMPREIAVRRMQRPRGFVKKFVAIGIAAARSHRRSSNPRATTIFPMSSSVMSAPNHPHMPGEPAPATAFNGAIPILFCAMLAGIAPCAAAPPAESVPRIPLEPIWRIARGWRRGSQSTSFSAR